MPLHIFLRLCHNIGMKRINPALILMLALPACASAQALDELLSNAGPDVSVAAPEAAPQLDGGFKEAEQYLPPNNDNPGFDWARTASRSDSNFFYIGKTPTFLSATAEQPADPANGSSKCELAANTLYKTSAKPGFEGVSMTVSLAEPLPGCQLTRGYVYIADVSSSSAGGAWQLPRTVHAFMDTLAYSEGTKDHYNYIFTFVTFNSYADHPRKVICSGKLCSSAAGRYQFLSKTWDPLAADLGLKDFTPPSQEIAGVELVRRAGAYELALKSDKYANFTAAVGKLNTIWASLPGSPYGQPTHTIAALWKAYQANLAKY
jgi:muramidase (phage lysozyme)